MALDVLGCLIERGMSSRIEKCKAKKEGERRQNIEKENNTAKESGKLGNYKAHHSQNTSAYLPSSAPFQILTYISL